MGGGKGGSDGGEGPGPRLNRGLLLGPRQEDTADRGVHSACGEQREEQRAEKEAEEVALEAGGGPGSPVS